MLPLTPKPDGSPPKPVPFLVTPAYEIAGDLSPDGRWLVYASDESSRPEIYVAPFRGPGGKHLVSTGGGRQPRWRADGKEIFHHDQDGVLMEAEVAINGAGLKVGAVRSLGLRTRTNLSILYDVSADGQRFLLPAAPQRKASGPPP